MACFGIRSGVTRPFQLLGMRQAHSPGLDTPQLSRQSTLSILVSAGTQPLAIAARTSSIATESALK